MEARYLAKTMSKTTTNNREMYDVLPDERNISNALNGMSNVVFGGSLEGTPCVIVLAKTLKNLNRTKFTTLSVVVSDESCCTTWDLLLVHYNNSQQTKNRQRSQFELNSLSKKSQHALSTRSGIMVLHTTNNTTHSHSEHPTPLQQQLHQVATHNTIIPKTNPVQ
jgi:hypothetical protein